MMTQAMQSPYTEMREAAPAPRAGWLEKLTDAICGLAAAAGEVAGKALVLFGGCAYGLLLVQKAK